MPETESPIGPTFDISIVDVCNNALDQIGHDPIGSFNEDSTAADACRRFFPSNLKAMIRDHKWRFAMRRVYLPQMAQEQIFQILAGFGSGGFGGGGFGGTVATVTVTAIPGPLVYWYALPANCIKPWRINGDDASVFAVQGRILMSDESPVYVDYSAYVDDPNLWPGDFQVAFEYWLASRLAQRLPKDLKLAGQLYSAYKDQCAQAMQTDSQVGTPEILVSNALIWGRE